MSDTQNIVTYFESSDVILCQVRPILAAAAHMCCRVKPHEVERGQFAGSAGAGGRQVSPPQPDGCGEPKLSTVVRAELLSIKKRHCGEKVRE